MNDLNAMTRVALESSKIYNKKSSIIKDFILTIQIISEDIILNL